MHTIKLTVLLGAIATVTLGNPFPGVTHSTDVFSRQNAAGIYTFSDTNCQNQLGQIGVNGNICLQDQSGVNSVLIDNPAGCDIEFYATSDCQYPDASTSTNVETTCVTVSYGSVSWKCP